MFSVLIGDIYLSLSCFSVAVFVAMTAHLFPSSLAAWQDKHLLALWGYNCFVKCIPVNSDNTMTYKLDFLSDVMKHRLLQCFKITICRDDAVNCRTELNDTSMSKHQCECIIRHSNSLKYLTLLVTSSLILQPWKQKYFISPRHGIYVRYFVNITQAVQGIRSPKALAIWSFINLALYPWPLKPISSPKLYHKQNFGEIPSTGLQDIMLTGRMPGHCRMDALTDGQPENNA